MDFALFILVTAILYIRPLDLVPGMEAVPLYLIAIVPCLMLSWHKLMPQLTMAALRERPVLVFAIGILLVSVFSSVLYRRFQVGFGAVVALGKVLIFYLLMLALVDSPRRLKLFLVCLVAIILIPIALAVLNYHGYISLRFDGVTDEVFSGPEAREPTAIKRLGTTGNFGDPNDVCEIVNCALIFSLCGLLNRGGGCTRVLWLGPMALLAHALALTHSRGGFLAAVVGLMVLLRSRFRGTKWLVVAGACLALLFVLFGGRQTSFSTSQGTGQSRIQIWNTGFELLQRSLVAPLIGIGVGQFTENVGHSGHNAFIQTYTELGFLGGTLLFGQYFFCLKNLKELGSNRVTLPDPEMRRMQPFIMASLASFATSEMSIANAFSLVTYVMLGLATIFIRLANPRPPLPDLRLNRKLIRQMTLFSGLFLVALYAFVKLSVRY